MVCTCERDGVRAVEDRRLAIFRRLGLRDMDSLVEAIVLSLAFDFGCAAEVYVDQWFGISLSTPLLGECIFVPCDEPQDGFAAAWEMLDQKFPGRASASTVKSEPRPLSGSDRNAVAERISAGLFSVYENFATAYREHRDGVHPAGDCPPCADCEVLLSLRIAACRALDVEWGSRSLDACVDAALER